MILLDSGPRMFMIYIQRKTKLSLNILFLGKTVGYFERRFNIIYKSQELKT